VSDFFVKKGALYTLKYGTIKNVLDDWMRSRAFEISSPMEELEQDDVSTHRLLRRRHQDGRHVQVFFTILA